MTTEWRRPRAGFRTRVIGSYAALLFVAGVAGLFVQRTILLARLDDQVVAALEQERSELQTLAQLGTDPATGEPFGDDVAAIFDTFLARNVPSEGEAFVTFVDGEPYTRTPAPLRLDLTPMAARWAALATGERGLLQTTAGDVRYLAVPLELEGRVAGVFVVANFVRAEREQIESWVRIEAVVSLGVLLATTALAWVVAGRLLRPVRQLTATARTISENDLSRRIPVEGDDELARLAGTFNQMLDRLEAAFSTQRAFVDDAGHELRTPITIIRGHLELMGDDPAEREETLALVTDELDRMARIVDDLLLLAKAEQPDFVQLEPVELSDLTTELFAKARLLGERTWTLEACAEGPLQADPQRLTQAVLNLARNALEHTPPRSEVAMGSSREGDTVRLWVRDHGPGIDHEDQVRIFERFGRARAGRRRSEGAGLGLSIVRAVAEAHGGHVDVDSRPGEGATFTVVLPAATPDPDPADDPEGAPWPAS